MLDWSVLLFGFTRNSVPLTRDPGSRDAHDAAWSGVGSSRFPAQRHFDAPRFRVPPRPCASSTVDPTRGSLQPSASTKTDMKNCSNARNPALAASAHPFAMIVDFPILEEHNLQSRA